MHRIARRALLLAIALGTAEAAAATRYTFVQGGWGAEPGLSATPATTVALSFIGEDVGGDGDISGSNDPGSLALWEISDLTLSWSGPYQQFTLTAAGPYYHQSPLSQADFLFNLIYELPGPLGDGALDGFFARDFTTFQYLTGPATGLPCDGVGVCGFMQIAGGPYYTRDPLELQSIVTSVPEPSGLGLLCLALAGLAALQPGRRRAH